MDGIPQFPTPNSYTFTNLQANHVINLCSVYTGVDEHCNPVIKLSPNPAHHFINSDHLDIDISDLSKGVYIIIMETKYGINPIKFVKQ